ncbi:hypothetical protein PtB15_13B386 [Puccinia triticina]|nr:hypothetical protein PtB15_13B386 [Puccinia triticina]
MRAVLYSSYYTDRPSGIHIQPLKVVSSAVVDPNLATGTQSFKKHSEEREAPLEDEQPAQESASPIEERPTLKIRIKRAKKVQVDAIPVVAPPAILLLPSPATKVVRKKRGRAGDQDTLAGDHGSPSLVPALLAAPLSSLPATAPAQLNPGASLKQVRPTKKIKSGPAGSATILAAAPLAPPPATAPSRLNPGAGAKRFRPTKKVKRGDSTPEVPPAPSPGGPKVLNVKKKVPSKAIKRPSASGFQPREVGQGGHFRSTYAEVC